MIQENSVGIVVQNCKKALPGIGIKMQQEDGQNGRQHEKIGFRNDAASSFG